MEKLKTALLSPGFFFGVVWGFSVSFSVWDWFWVPWHPIFSAIATPVWQCRSLLSLGLWMMRPWHHRWRRSQLWQLSALQKPMISDIHNKHSPTIFLSCCQNEQVGCGVCEQLPNLDQIWDIPDIPIDTPVRLRQTMKEIMSEISALKTDVKDSRPGSLAPNGPQLVPVGPQHLSLVCIPNCKEEWRLGGLWSGDTAKNPLVLAYETLSLFATLLYRLSMKPWHLTSNHALKWLRIERDFGWEPFTLDLCGAARLLWRSLVVMALQVLFSKSEWERRRGAFEEVCGQLKDRGRNPQPFAQRRRGASAEFERTGVGAPGYTFGSCSSTLPDATWLNKIQWAFHHRSDFNNLELMIPVLAMQAGCSWQAALSQSVARSWDSQGMTHHAAT